MITLRGYNIEKQVFKGITGVVYCGVRESDHRPVLIEVPSQKRTNKSTIEDLKHEVETSGEIKVQAILKPLAVVESGPAIIYEYFEGLPLMALAPRLKNDVRAILEIALRLAKAVGSIHKREITHRNLNPETIFYDPKGGRLKIGGFRLATLLTRERPRIVSIHSLQGMPEYISPEQTGCCTPMVDFRSDLYSVGSILYKLLTGRAPFEARDPMRLVHALCSHEPEAPRALAPNTPREVSDVVMTLLSKRAGNRHQNADSLYADLEICLDRLSNPGKHPFVPGKMDDNQSFIMPERFFGREKEISVLKEALTDVSHGHFSFHIIGGDAGNGKMSLIREAQKEALQSAGYIARDSFTPLSKAIPYSAIKTALHALILQIMEEGPSRLDSWRKEVLSALGSNVGLLASIIPEITLLTGEQTMPLRLPEEEEAMRLERAFLDFLAAIARKARPLILVLTELQWADAASLNLLLGLVNRGEIPYFSFIGACQTARVPPGHALEPVLEKLRENAVDFGFIRLRPYSRNDTSAFVAEALDTDERRVGPLCQLIYEKTGGNPYFITQFLASLHKRKLLRSDSETGEWAWDRDEIAELEMTENMGDNLLQQLETLSKPTLDLLQSASIIGDEFSLACLAELTDLTPAQTATDLWEAVQQGMIAPMGESYRIFIPGEESTPAVSVHLEGNERFRFAHPRIRNTTYSMLGEGNKTHLHLKLGYYLKNGKGNGATFLEMVNHFNLGRSQISEMKELRLLAEDNLAAGKQARDSAAYASGAAFCLIGLDLLGSSNEMDHLYLKIQVLRAECEYLNHNMAEAERIIDSLSVIAPEGLDLARALDLKVILCANRGRNLEGIESGYNALRILGIRFPKGEEMVNAATRKELQRFESEWAGRSIADLADLPEMTSPEKRLAIKILTNLVPLWNQSFQTEGRRIMLLALRGINLSVVHGNSAHSAVCYCLYGMFSVEWHNHPRVGLELGKLGMALAQRFGSGLAICRTNNIFGAFINHWSSNARTSLNFLEDGFRAGKNYGQPVYAVYALVHKLVIRSMVEPKLADVYRASQEYRDYVSRTGYREFLDFLLSYQWMLDKLMGHEDAFFEYQPFLNRISGYQDKIPMCIHFLNEAKIAFILEDYERAVKMSFNTREHIGFLTGSLLVAEHVFFEAMSLAALYPTAPLEDQRKFLRKIEEHQRKMDFWADHCPENFLHLKLLVEASFHALHEQHLDAMQVFDQAIEAAQGQDCRAYEALANELAGKFYLAKGRRKIATIYMTDAFVAYREWGAVAKCRQLEARYREYIRMEFAGMDANVERGGMNFPHRQETDFVSLLRTSDLSMEDLDHETVIEQMLNRALEVTGGRAAFLLLRKSGSWRVKAEGWHDERGVAVLRGVPIDDCVRITPRVIDHVLETQMPLLLANASREGQFTQEPRIIKNKSKSILCVPAFKSNRLHAICYLENNLVQGVFDQEHAEAVQVLMNHSLGLF